MMSLKILFSAVPAAFVTLASTTAFAAEWTRVTELPAGEFLSVYGSGNTLYAGGAGLVYTKQDCAGNWETSSQTDPAADNVAAMIKIGNRLFAGVWAKGVFESTDGGTNWTPRNNGLTGTGGTFPMAFTVRGDSLYLATEGEAIFVMNLNGTATWSHYRDGLDFGIQWNVRCIHNYQDVLIAGAGANGTVSTRTRVQNAWQTVQFSEFAGQELSMLDLRSNGDVIYGAAHNGLYASTDGGQSWEQYLTSIGFISSAGVCVSNDQIFAMVCKPGLFTRIYQRSQGTWVLFDEIAGAVAYDVAIHCNRMYLAQANGLWYRELNPTDVEDEQPILPIDANLRQNYPNPFNPSTAIEFDLQRSGHVVLSVINIIGQEVKTLSNEYYEKGIHRVDWNGEDKNGKVVPSGVYFYMLRSESIVETRKMILAK